MDLLWKPVWPDLYRIPSLILSLSMWFSEPPLNSAKRKTIIRRSSLILVSTYESNKCFLSNLLSLQCVISNRRWSKTVQITTILYMLTFHYLKQNHIARSKKQWHIEYALTQMRLPQSQITKWVNISFCYRAGNTTTSGQSSYSFLKTSYAAMSYLIVHIWIICALKKAWLYWGRE